MDEVTMVLNGEATCWCYSRIQGCCHFGLNCDHVAPTRNPKTREDGPSSKQFARN